MYDVAWLETGEETSCQNIVITLSHSRIGEYVVTWALQSGTFIFFLALYGMGQLLVPSDIDLPSSSASPSLDLANNSSDERLSAEEL